MILSWIEFQYARRVLRPVRQARRVGVSLPESFRLPWWSTPCYRLLRLAVWASGVRWSVRRFLFPPRVTYFLRRE
jgi:hypothetical protein